MTDHAKATTGENIRVEFGAEDGIIRFEYTAGYAFLGVDVFFVDDDGGARHIGTLDEVTDREGRSRIQATVRGFGVRELFIDENYAAIWLAEVDAAAGRI